MSNLTIISYYGSVETFILAEDALKKQGFNVSNFPLFKYMRDSHDKVDNYTELLIDFIKNNKIDYLLWWFIGIPTENFVRVKTETNVKYLFFNWDEPYNWSYCDIIKKMPYFDTVFVTCQETLKTYLDNGTKKAVCLYPGFDSKINYRITDIKCEDYKQYNCDISFCTTNLYEDDNLYPNQYINRKQLIDNIYEGQNMYGYQFYIYGPASFKDLYPKSYRGFAKYDTLNKIFNYSKINLCSHVMANKNGYLNERVFLVGGSGGLLLVDAVKGIENIFSVNKHLLILDKHFYVKQIADIIQHYDKYIEIRNSFNKECLEKYTYDSWAKTIKDSL